MMLSELQPGMRFRILQVTVGGELGKRLADLGFVAGTEGLVVRSAFMRGPLQVRLRDCDLILRRHEAHFVEVTPLELSQETSQESKPLPGPSSSHPVIDVRPFASSPFRRGKGIHRHGLHRPGNWFSRHGSH
ncbi:MAG: FeoA family protein [Spirochaetales bacterium]|nr:FeoA family protein [Spirochaetales bacterium]